MSEPAPVKLGFLETSIFSTITFLDRGDLLLDLELSLLEFLPDLDFDSDVSDLIFQGLYLGIGVSDLE